MIISRSTLDSTQYDPSMMAIHENAVILDIETTGFSAKFASIYMIGMIHYDILTQSLILEQWFCEKPSDEYELLFRFNKLIQKPSQLFHYNGDQFDMPFIKQRMERYKMTCNAFTSHDFLKIIRPFKQTLNFENLKLKTIEGYFDYHRMDTFSGGDLIAVYEEFLDTKDEGLLKVLLLHNYEDLLGLHRVIMGQPLFDFLSKLKNQTLNIDLTTSQMKADRYSATFTVPEVVHLLIEKNIFSISADKGLCTVSVILTIGELKYFFDSPSDYYYLPTEDYAIHKGIGKFVDKAHRVPANKENCYVKKEGVFLPSYKNLRLPFNHYYTNYKDVLGYIALEELVETDGFTLYLKGLMSLI